MNFIAWLLALTLLITVLIQAVAFQQATVCRQKAWLKATELQTHTLLDDSKDHNHAVDIGCKVYVNSKHGIVAWRRLPNSKLHRFTLSMKGKI